MTQAPLFETRDKMHSPLGFFKSPLTQYIRCLNGWICARGDDVSECLLFYSISHTVCFTFHAHLWNSPWNAKVTWGAASLSYYVPRLHMALPWHITEARSAVSLKKILIIQIGASAFAIQHRLQFPLFCACCFNGFLSLFILLSASGFVYILSNKIKIMFRQTNSSVDR